MSVTASKIEQDLQALQKMVGDLNTNVFAMGHDDPQSVHRYTAAIGNGYREIFGIEREYSLSNNTQAIGTVIQEILSRCPTNVRQNVTTVLNSIQRSAGADRETRINLQELLIRTWSLVKKLEQTMQPADGTMFTLNGQAVTPTGLLIANLSHNIVERGGCIPGIAGRLVQPYMNCVLKLIERRVRQEQQEAEERQRAQEREQEQTRALAAALAALSTPVVPAQAPSQRLVLRLDPSVSMPAVGTVPAMPGSSPALQFQVPQRRPTQAPADPVATIHTAREQADLERRAFEESLKLAEDARAGREAQEAAELEAALAASRQAAISTQTPRPIVHPTQMSRQLPATPAAVTKVADADLERALAESKRVTEAQRALREQTELEAALTASRQAVPPVQTPQYSGVRPTPVHRHVPAAPVVATNAAREQAIIEESKRFAEAQRARQEAADLERAMAASRRSTAPTVQTPQRPAARPAETSAALSVEELDPELAAALEASFSSSAGARTKR